MIATFLELRTPPGAVNIYDLFTLSYDTPASQHHPQQPPKSQSMSTPIPNSFLQNQYESTPIHQIPFLFTLLGID